MTRAQLRAACLEMAPDFRCVREWSTLSNTYVWAATCMRGGKRYELSYVDTPNIDTEHRVLEGAYLWLKKGAPS